MAGNQIRIEGTVHLLGVEGGCWQLAADDGETYELRRDQAPAEILVDGATVTVLARRRADLMSLCMVGQIIDVLRVEK